MRHLLLAATMLAAALVVTFGAASALEGAALAQDNGVQNGQFEAIQAAKPELKTADAIKRVSSLFAALGDETRLLLIARLSGGPMSIAKLTAGSKITRQAITKHLRVMQTARLVHSTRRGRESLWDLDRQRLEDARRHIDQISSQWDEALSRLRRFVEE